jgi:hypothetical protein
MLSFSFNCQYNSKTQVLYKIRTQARRQWLMPITSYNLGGWEDCSLRSTQAKNKSSSDPISIGEKNGHGGAHLSSQQQQEA